MGLLIYFIIAILAFCKPKSKKIAVVVAAFMVVIFGFNTASGDYSMYKWIYEELYTWKGIGLLGAHEPGFELLMIICKALNLSYQSFRVVIGIVCALLTYKTTCRLTEYPAVAMVIYILNPFMGFVSGIRAGISSVVVMYALADLMYAKDKPILKYILGIMVATMFHYSAIAYLLLLVLKIEMPINRMLLICAVVSAFVTFAVHGSTLMYDFLNLLTDNKKVLMWFNLNSLGTEKMSIRGKLYTLGLLTYIIMLSSFALYRMSLNQLTDTHGKTGYFSKRVCIILITFLPLFFINGTFLRYIGEVLLLVICASVEGSAYLAKKSPDGWEKLFDPIILITLIVVITILVDNRSMMLYTGYHYFTPFFENTLFSRFS